MSYAKINDDIEPINLEILTGVRRTVWVGGLPPRIIYIRIVDVMKFVDDFDSGLRF